MDCFKLDNHYEMKGLNLSPLRVLPPLEENEFPQKVALDYSPYGMLLQHRHGNDDKYRYGFQGMERDDEPKGGGNSYTTEFRQYDARIGRWLTLDPLASKYAGMTPYGSFNNNPMRFTDNSGLEGTDWIGRTENGVTKWHYDPNVTDPSQLPAGYTEFAKNGTFKANFKDGDYSGPVILEAGYAQHISSGGELDEFTVTPGRAGSDASSGTFIQESYAMQTIRQRRFHQRLVANGRAMDYLVIGMASAPVAAFLGVEVGIAAAPWLAKAGTLGTSAWEAAEFSYVYVQTQTTAFLTEVAATKAGAWGLATLEVATGYGWYSNNAQIYANPNSLIRTESGRGWSESTRVVAGIMPSAKASNAGLFGRISGIKNPVSVYNYEGNNYILNGHHRVHAAIRLNQPVPIRYLPNPYLKTGSHWELLNEARNAMSKSFQVDGRVLNNLLNE